MFVIRKIKAIRGSIKNIYMNFKDSTQEVEKNIVTDILQLKNLLIEQTNEFSVTDHVSQHDFINKDQPMYLTGCILKHMQSLDQSSPLYADLQRTVGITEQNPMDELSANTYIDNYENYIFSTQATLADIEVEATDTDLHPNDEELLALFKASDVADILEHNSERAVQVATLLTFLSTSKNLNPEVRMELYTGAKLDIIRQIPNGFLISSGSRLRALLTETTSEFNEEDINKYIQRFKEYKSHTSFSASLDQESSSFDIIKGLIKRYAEIKKDVDRELQISIIQDIGNTLKEHSSIPEQAQKSILAVTLLLVSQEIKAELKYKVGEMAGLSPTRSKLYSLISVTLGGLTPKAPEILATDIELFLTYIKPLVFGETAQGVECPRQGAGGTITEQSKEFLQSAIPQINTLLTDYVEALKSEAPPRAEQTPSETSTIGITSYLGRMLFGKSGTADGQEEEDIEDSAKAKME